MAAPEKMENKNKHIERKKPGINAVIFNHINLINNFKDVDEKKRQIRQQHILNIVNNSSQNGIKKTHIITKKLPTNSQYVPINNFKIKTSQDCKLSQKEESKSSSKGNRNYNSKNYQQTNAAPSTWKYKHFVSSTYCEPCVNENHKKVDAPIKITYDLQSLRSNEDLCKSSTVDISMKNSSHNLSYLNQKEIIKQKVQEAVKSQKIFLIRGDIPYLEKSFRNRGWIQKYESTKTRHIPYGTNISLNTSSLGDIHLPDSTLNEKAFIFQELKNVSPNFIWDCRNDFVKWKDDIKPETILNRLEKSYIYTSKLGMATILEESHWFLEDKVADVLYPRSYNVSRDKSAFIDDYRRTAAISLLKWFVNQVEQGVDLVNKGISPISPKRIEFAMKRCEDMIATANNDNLDVTEASEISCQEWDEFIDDYVKAVLENNGLIFQDLNCNETKEDTLSVLYTSSVEILKTIKALNPQFDLDGMRNIWILKPNSLCCGYGIAMTHKLNNILKKVNNSPKNYFLVQKYIEKPLLIKNTKFDVRHWYLVTKSYPLTIWVYRESLLRFSSRPFTFLNYHEAIHICNTAVQCKYSDQKNPVRSLNWNCEMINQYLKRVVL